MVHSGRALELEQTMPSYGSLETVPSGGSPHGQIGQHDDNRGQWGQWNRMPQWAFLGIWGALALTLGLYSRQSSPLGWLDIHPPHKVHHHSKAYKALESLERGMSGSVLRGDNISHIELITGPIVAVVRVSTVSDVQLALPSLVKLHDRYRIPYCISISDFNSCASSGGIILALGELDDLEVSYPATNSTQQKAIASYGVGLSARLFLKEVSDNGYGGLTMPKHNISMGDFVLRNGVGESPRLFGVAADSVISLQVVLKDGSLVTTDAYGDQSGLFGSCLTEFPTKDVAVVGIEQRLSASFETKVSVKGSLPASLAPWFLVEFGNHPPPAGLSLDLSGRSSRDILLELQWKGVDNDDLMEGEEWLRTKLPVFLPTTITSKMNFDRVPVSRSYRADDFSSALRASFSDVISSSQNTAKVWTAVFPQLLSVCNGFTSLSIELLGGAVSLLEEPSAVLEGVYFIHLQVEVPTSTSHSAETFHREVGKAQRIWNDISRYF